MIPRIYVALAIVAGLLATWGAYVAGVWADRKSTRLNSSH